MDSLLRLRPCCRPRQAKSLGLHRFLVHAFARGSASATLGSKTHQERKLVTFFYSDYAEVPMPKGHRFPMHKYREVRRSLQLETEDWAEAWLKTNRAKLAPEDAWRTVVRFDESPYCTEDDLLLVHDPIYVRKVLDDNLNDKERRRIGIPADGSQGIARSLASTGGTVAALHSAMSSPAGVSGQIAGGTHHAHRDFGSGFCVFNDLAVTARVALRDYSSITKVLILDLDVHQGDGTAELLGGETNICTFSMHGRNNFPLRKSHRGTFDVELSDNTNDSDYLARLADWMPQLFQDFQPHLVLYQAGVDALAEDTLGKLALTREGLQQRNDMVYNACWQHGCRLVVTMGGGYSRPIDATVSAHADVYRALLQHVATNQARPHSTIR